ncbi:hypothetical protein E4L95_13460 [Paracoccus liaowanqingii]|uniref:Uncharacterized protein n=1 Tax=Paracoccus liaowanqingii TaxID=2560053 RepID=A0A4Z1C9P1_9RHOB|nr:hypothetical protein [Paracoccus liaowanqingii]TGN57278.1 hypothetical protein E4L95_13460 [Paracoccus liaowanqingii]
MSYNHDDPQKAASKHKPAIIAIIVALVVAGLAFLVFTPGADEQGDGIATTAPPSDVPVTDAAGLGEDTAPPMVSDADTPAAGTTAPAGTVDAPAGADAPAN